MQRYREILIYMQKNLNAINVKEYLKKVNK